MRNATIRWILTHLAILAGVHFAATTSAAQRDGDALSARELRASAEPQLLGAIAELRPHWLPAEGAETRVLVYLNGRHFGDARVLQGIPTDEVVSARLRSTEYVRRTDPRFPREEFDMAIFVATRGAPRPSPQGRVTVTLDAGFNPRSVGHVMDDALAEQGYTAKSVPSATGTVRFADEGPRFPPSVGATVNYGVRGPWGVAATGQHTINAWTGGFNPQTGTAVSADLGSTEGSLLITREAGVFRAGVGPAYRRLSWAWWRGFCGCSSSHSGSSGAFGVMAEGVTQLPLSGRVFPALRVLARYYPSQETEYEFVEQPVDAGGLIVTIGVSLAGRF